MAAAKNTSMLGYPELVIDPMDVSGSWSKWFNHFKMILEYKTLELGTVVVDTVSVPKFGERSKLLALTSSVGEEGREALVAVGFDVDDRNATYDAALKLLREHFEQEESVYVRTQKFVTVHQLVGESERDYLVRVEKLGRDIDWVKSDQDDVQKGLDDMRVRFGLVLAVNGLRDTTVRRELLQKRNLTWETMVDSLRARSGAREADAKLSEGSSNVPMMPVKQEIFGTSVGSKKLDGDSYSASQSRASFAPEWRTRPVAYGNRESSPASRSGAGNAGSVRGYSPVSRGYAGARSPSRGMYYGGRSGGGERQARSPSRDTYYNRRNEGGDWRDRSSYDVGRGRRQESNSPAKDWGRQRGYSPAYNRSDSQAPSGCFVCGGDHFARECPNIQCHNCQGRGHIARNCKHRPSREGQSPVRGRSPERRINHLGEEGENKLGRNA